MLVSSGFSLSFPTLYLCLFSSSTSLPGWKITQLGLCVLREVEWTNDNTRGLVVVGNMRNVVVARPGKQGSHWCCGQGHLGSASVVQGLACVDRALKWCKQQNTWKALLSVFSSFLSLGPADGSYCRNQKLLPSTINTGVRLSIQWWHLQNSNKKGRGKELDPSVKKGI